MLVHCRNAPFRRLGSKTYHPTPPHHTAPFRTIRQPAHLLRSFLFFPHYLLRPGVLARNANNSMQCTPAIFFRSFEPTREFITLRRLPAGSMQQGLDGFASSGLQVDARLYAMAVGYTLGARAAAETAAETANDGKEGRCLQRRQHARRALAVAALAVTTVVAVVVGSRRTRS